MSRQTAVLDRTGEDPEAPLIAGLMIGVRAWNVNLAHGEDCRLLGYGEYPWRQGGLATVAECGTHASWQSGGGCLCVPGPECSCGLYAFHPWSMEMEVTHRKHGPFRDPGELRVAGVIQAWGRIELHEDGFRAERARPIAIVLPREPLEEDEQQAFDSLARRYRVPALRPTSGQRAHRFAMRRCQITRETVSRLLSADDLEQTGPEWDRMPELIPVPFEPSRFQPAAAAAASVLRACGSVVNAMLNFAYFLLMAIIGLLMWAVILSLWLPLIGGILYVMWLIAAGTFEMVFG